MGKKKALFRRRELYAVGSYKPDPVSPKGDDHLSMRSEPGTPSEEDLTSSELVPYLILHRMGFTLPLRSR